MNLKSTISVSILGMFLINASSAAAQVAEVRIGIAEFDERTLNLEGGTFQRANERSLSISGEVLFKEPEFLKWALSPQPYIGGALNLEGNTSFAGAGLLWRQTVGKKFYTDYAFGLVAHTGTKLVRPSDSQLAILESSEDIETLGPIFDDIFARLNNEIQFGSRVLFRLQGAIGYNINEDWAGEVYIEHLSNGGIFSDERNDGVNILGVRAARKF